MQTNGRWIRRALALAFLAIAALTLAPLAGGQVAQAVSCPNNVCT